MATHNHQASDGPDYEGCPACIEHDVRRAAGEVFTAEGVEIWMDAPNRMLNNATPLQFIAAGDASRVFDVIAGLAEGVTS